MFKMINRITQPSQECRFNLPFRLDYQCDKGYELSKVGDNVTLSIKMENLSDEKTHTYVFRFKKDQRGALFREMLNPLNDSKKPTFSRETITYCAKLLNVNFGYNHYDPRDNVEHS